MQKLGLLTIILLFLTAFSFGQTSAQLKKAAELFDQGLAFHNSHQWDQAIQSYTEYIKIRPDQSNVWYNRRLARYSKGIEFSNNTTESSRKLLEEAVADYTQSIKLDPKFANAWSARGETYLMLRMFSANYADLAISDLSQALKLAPNTAKANLLRGKAYAEKNQPDSALIDFNKALQLSPQNADAYFERGKIYYNLKNMKPAQADFEAVLRLSPTHPYAKRWLEGTNEKTSPAQVSTTQTWQTAFEAGKVFLQRNDADQAIASFQKALTLLPTNVAGDQIELLMAQQKGQILENIARAYIVKKDYDNAINNCLSGQKFIHQTLVSKFARVERFKFDPNMLVEVSKSKIDFMLINYDLLLAQSGGMVEIGKRCFDAFPQNGLSDSQKLSLMGVGIMKIGTAEFVSDMLWTASSLRLSLSQLCQGKGKNICGESSRNNEIAKYANKSLEDINKAIEYSPALKKLYLHRAEVYRHLGRNDLALADERKAGQSN